jgi:hypothetical protein
MLEKKQDSTNSKREWSAGGDGFNNLYSINPSENTLHIGQSPVYSVLNGPIESGYGHFGVGLEPFPVSGYNWYNTIVSDNVLVKSTKWQFGASMSEASIQYPWASPYVVNVPRTLAGRFLRAQYQDSHLISGSVSLTTVVGSSTFYFMESSQGVNNTSLFTVPYCEARAFRLLATVNGIGRNSGTQSRSFSAYWDISFGIQNLSFCGGSSSFIGGGYLDQVSRSSFINTGTLALGGTPSLTIDLPGDEFLIQVSIAGSFSMTGSAKLTRVESGTLDTTWIKPT